MPPKAPAASGDKKQAAQPTAGQQADPTLPPVASDETIMASARAAFDRAAAGEQLAVDLAAELVERASALYVETLYDRLAIEYTALNLWDLMAGLVAVNDVKPDQDHDATRARAAAAAAAAADGLDSQMGPGRRSSVSLLDGSATMSPDSTSQQTTQQRQTQQQSNNNSNAAVRSGKPAGGKAAVVGIAAPGGTSKGLNTSSSGSKPKGAKRSVRISSDAPTSPTEASVTAESSLAGQASSDLLAAAALPAVEPLVPVVRPPTWEPDAPPPQIPCDLHTRHNIPLHRKLRSAPAGDQTVAGSPAGSDRLGLTPPSTARPGRRSGKGSGGAPRSDASASASHHQLLSVRGALSDAGSSRPGSRASSLGSTTMRPGGGTFGTSSALNATQVPSHSNNNAAALAASAKRRMSRAPGTAPAAPTAAPAPAEEPAVPTPTADGDAADGSGTPLLSSEEQRREAARRLQLHIAAQLADTKALERGFVVDGPSGQVVPLVPPEEMLGQAKKLAEPLKFIVPEHQGSSSSAAAAAAATPAGQRTGGVPRTGTTTATDGTAKKPSYRDRKEENFFVPDLTAVAMVQPATPSGGVTVKDAEGAPRTTELRVPKNKMTRQDYMTSVKAQLTATPVDSTVDPAAPPPPLKLAGSAGGAGGAALTAREKPTAASAAAPTTNGSQTARAAGGSATGAMQPPRPPGTAPSGVARRLPMTPAAAGGDASSKKAKARAAAAQAKPSPRKPSVTTALGGRDLLSEDII